MYMGSTSVISKTQPNDMSKTKLLIEVKEIEQHGHQLLPYEHLGGRHFLRLRKEDLTDN